MDKKKLKKKLREERDVWLRWLPLSKINVFFLDNNEKVFDGKKQTTGNHWEHSLQNVSKRKKNTNEKRPTLVLFSLVFVKSSDPCSMPKKD